MKIAVVKYNAGNIYSVDYALKRLGVKATITSDKEVLMSADKVIFPGVGEAETTMSHLRKNRLDEVNQKLKTTCTRYLPGNAADVPALRRRKCRLLGHL